MLGAGWSSGAASLESRSWGEADGVALAARMAYRQAGIHDPAEEVDLAEVDDTYAYKELEHLEALGLATAEELAELLEDGELEADGELPVNVSGGSLGMGNLFEANGLARLQECVEQLRGEAGERQVDEVYTAVAQSWLGVPSTTGAVIVVANDEGAGG